MAKSCNYPYCPNRIERGAFCNAHKFRAAVRQKKTTSRGYGHEWSKASKSYLLTHDECADCGMDAKVVDHIIPHRGDHTLFWDVSNWQPLCKSCHSRKTSRGE
jgi:5-methylcytosine-specific restriction protein A